MLARGFGGAERSFVDTALALAERGHEVQAICQRDFSEKDRLLNRERIRVDLIKAGGEWDFFAPRRIARLLSDFKSEIVHTQLKRAAWHGGRGAKMVNVPVVAKLHNYVELGRYRHMSMLLCTTEDQMRHIKSRGWDMMKARWLPNFSRLRPVERIRDGWQEPLNILSCGRYVEKKGFEYLLRAFAQLLDSGIDARLRIGGKGEQQAALEEIVKELGIVDKVQLGFWIDDVSEELDRADFFVLPSLDEPFGIVMLEAMARGVPIVTTKTKGPLEVLSGETAKFAEIGQADSLFRGMREVILDPKVAMERSQAALDLYEAEYYSEAVLPRLEAIYQDVIKSSRN